MRQPSDLQIFYQRNMLYGLLLASGLAVLVAVYIAALDTPRSPTHYRAVVWTEHPARQEELLTASSSPSLISPLGVRPASLDGFLGFRNIRPTGDVPVPGASPESVELPTGTLEVAFSDATIGGIGDFDGGLDYLPVNAAIMSEPVTEPGRQSVNRDILVVNRVDPEYPWVAREEGKEGEIIVLVYLDSTGNLSTFPDWITGNGIRTLEYTVDGRTALAEYALSERPEGWYFASNFLKVLPHWRFAPCIENGRPVASLLRIKYTFCLGINCSKYELQQVRSE